jgi:CRISPR system Cascade subunit CasE
MYFSLITPAPGREREAAHEWADGPYSEHQWLWRFFPAPDGTSRDFLFRRQDVGGFPRFYVVSSRPPQSQGLAWHIQATDYAPRLQTGQWLRFDLRANPVVTRSQDGKSGRHDVVMDEKRRLLQERGLAHWKEWQGGDKPPLHDLVQKSCLEWLQSRASRLGFEIDEQSLIVDRYQRHTEKEGRLRFSTADFSGILKVTDPAAFEKTLYAGVGHAKAFGCGLLLVRRTA